MVLESNKTVWAMGTNEFNIIGLGALGYSIYLILFL